ncbi:glycosyltransferase family 4 protein [Pedobacter rhizosphaerae]|uniref:Glycosyltransferase involved in cell wall bisynthesis n=1 Tax=Pedobacter rhizosphaerae TaxID=390241 RepID=A0A1H9M4E8_9SPHI|nr:glycosyltransferase family 4 protein [Pedobacter rhizosphaerae]SER18389.1 Glycosyltransferase involved in cell wall bisynthesis [Pedobacter rhizosphaerae]
MATKLCFVISSLEGGGAERVLSNLANHFSGKDFDVTVICLNQAPSKYVLSPKIKLKVLVDRKGKTDIFSRLKFAAVTFFNLIATLKKEKPACCISFMTSVNIWTGIACMLLNIKYILSERTSPDYTLNTYSKWLQWISYQIYSKSKAVVLPAKGMEAGFKRNKRFRTLSNFKTIYNPVNVFNQPSKKQVNSRPFILSVGRLDPDKCFDLVIEAYSKIPNQDIDLLISGEGDCRAALEKQISDLKLSDRVKLIGFKSNLQDYYSQAKLFVMASRVEGYPNVLVEAMSLGCAAIAMDCEFGPSEIINNGVNGFLIKCEDVEALTQSMTELLSNETLRSTFATNGKLISKTNSMENISMNWENLILS